jgi:serine/threonine protein kinase
MADSCAGGRPAYLSPEEVMGAAAGLPAEVYALTTIAYEYLTGATPFDGGDPLEVLFAQVHREPPPASSRRPELSAAVDAVLIRGLAKDPAERWESGAEMLAALRAALDAPPPPAVFPARRRRRSVLVVRVAAILLIGMALGLLALARVLSG